jgi:hypothetical protein
VAKLRSDSKLADLERRLTAVERDELVRIARHGSLADLRTFAESHGVPVSLAGSSRMALRLRNAADRLLKRNAALAVLRQEAEKSGITLTGAALDQIALALSDTLDAAAAPDSPEGRKLLLGAATALTGIRNSEIGADRVRASREALALAERRVQLLEQKQAEAGKVVADTKLSPAERERKLKDIFGIQ